MFHFYSYIDEESFPVTVTVMLSSGVGLFRGLHSHDFSEICIVSSGSINRLTRNLTTPLTAGDFFLVHPGGELEWSDPSPDAVVYNVLYDGNIPIPMLISRNMPFLEQLYPDFKSDKFYSFSEIYHLPELELKKVINILDLIKQENQERKPGYQTAVIALFMTAILFFARSYTSRFMNEAKYRRQRVFAYLNSHFSEHFTLQDLAKKMGMSPSTLFRRFKADFGVGPAEYLQKVRINQAITLLRNSAHSNEFIAFQCGFYNYSHMWKLFQKHLHCSPTDIRSEKNAESKNCL
ncbi:MAG: AraC family transcriptional regulator [Victivallales bacterium]|jgi:AraC-like DNA-binding protein|nr:AraC family transcriptional regulator [Victivallales bacterium]